MFRAWATTVRGGCWLRGGAGLITAILSSVAAPKPSLKELVQRYSGNGKKFTVKVSVCAHTTNYTYGVNSATCSQRSINKNTICAHVPTFKSNSNITYR